MIEKDICPPHWTLLPAMTTRLYKTMAILLVASNLIACGESDHRPDPVERKNGLAYIPINNTAFLIQEKSWLKGYSRKKTDGLVSNITLHATVPDVQPWSPERNKEMYWPAGPGKKLLIYIWGNREYQPSRFPTVPNSIFSQSDFVEEESDQASQGLRKFREKIKFQPSSTELENLRRKFSEETISSLIKKNGTIDAGREFYELIEGNRVKYLIYCDTSGNAIFTGCHLFFPWQETLMIEVYFIRDEINNIVEAADRISEKLREFENNGLAYKANLQAQPGDQK